MPENKDYLYDEIMSIIRKYDPELIAKDPYKDSHPLEIESTVKNAIQGYKECVYHLKMHLLHIDHQVGRDGNIEGEYFIKLFLL